MEKTFEKGVQIIKKLKSEGYEAYFVGGYVRDTLLKLKTKDIDITTNASVETVKALFKRVKLTGEKYGTVTVIIDKHPFEVTTYRKEKNYLDSRHPESVSFNVSLEEDLSRRDFTINQLIMDEEGMVHDHHHGLQDLEKKCIRTINDPFERFNEDALRILRAFRFMAKLGFTIEQETLSAIYKTKALLSNLPIERVQGELDGIFNAKHKHKTIETIVENRVHTVFKPLQKGFEKLVQIKSDYPAIIAYTILVYENKETINLLKLSKDQAKTIKILITLHKKTKNTLFTPLDIFTYNETIIELVNLLNTLYGGDDQLAHTQKLRNNLVINDIKALNINGKDILSLKELSNPKHIQPALDTILKKVLNKDLNNDKQTLIEAAKHYLSHIEKS